jgi:hypothetical protein
MRLPSRALLCLSASATGIAIAAVDVGDRRVALSVLLSQP